MGGLGDIHGLSESHQFILLLLAQVTFLVTQIFLYRSAPPPKKKVPDGNATAQLSVSVSEPTSSDTRSNN